MFNYMTMTAEAVTEAVTEASKVGFEPETFVKNLGYMGSGMLGIFVVIGIIVTITYILNAVTRKKK